MRLSDISLEEMQLSPSRPTDKLQLSSTTTLLPRSVDMANNSDTFVAIQPSSGRSECLRPCFFLLFVVLLVNTSAMVYLLIRECERVSLNGTAQTMSIRSSKLSINGSFCLSVKEFYARRRRKIDNDKLFVRDCVQTADSTYWRLELPMTWPAAQNSCRSFHHQANLVSIHSFEEKQLVYNLALDSTYFDKRTFESGGVWIGLRTLRDDLTDHTTYTWADKTSVKYADWLQTETESHPVRDSKHGGCAKVLYFVASLIGGLTVGWDNDNCHAQHKFICKLRQSG